MEIKPLLIAASYALALFVGWHSHTWYDGYLENKGKDAIIDGRIEGEKGSNADAAKTAHKEAEDDEKAKDSDGVLVKHIEADKQGFGCGVPVIGMHDLQQAVTSHTRARKSDGTVP